MHSSSIPAYVKLQSWGHPIVANHNSSSPHYLTNKYNHITSIGTLTYMHIITTITITIMIIIITIITIIIVIAIEIESI